MNKIRRTKGLPELPLISPRVIFNRQIKFIMQSTCVAHIEALMFHFPTLLGYL